MKKEPIPSNQPIFKLPYQDCKNHGEKLNYICLDSGCHQSRIICSLCKDQHHSKHSTRPLKFYITELQQKYQNTQSQSSLNELLDELEVCEFTFSQQLKKAVEDIAEQFQKLQEDVMHEIHTIRSQIFEEVHVWLCKIAKRNRFNEFYDNLKRGRIQQSNFMIQNYLPQSSIGKIANFEKIERVSYNVCNEISCLKRDLISRQDIESKGRSFKKQLEKHSSESFINEQAFNLKMMMKTPPTINFDNLLLTQTNFLPGVKSLCIIDYPISQISGKINFTIQKLNVNASVMISVMTKQLYNQMNECWSQQKLKYKSFVLGSNGFQYGWKKGTMTQFGQNSMLSLSCKSNQVRIDQKSKYCMGQLLPEKEFYIVLALMGDCQVKVKHKM